MIDPASYITPFQNVTSLAKFGGITCHRMIAGYAAPCATLAGPPFSLICSIGAWLHSAHAGTSGELISAADAAVYGAKRAGKNCARMAERTNQQTGNGRVMIHAAP